MSYIYILYNSSYSLLFSVSRTLRIQLLGEQVCHMNSLMSNSHIHFNVNFKCQSQHVRQCSPSAIQVELYWSNACCGVYRSILFFCLYWKGTALKHEKCDNNKNKRVKFSETISKSTYCVGCLRTLPYMRHDNSAPFALYTCATTGFVKNSFHCMNQHSWTYECLPEWTWMFLNLIMFKSFDLGLEKQHQTPYLQLKDLPSNCSLLSCNWCKEKSTIICDGCCLLRSSGQCTDAEQ
jgi:hypothetical protein